MKEERFVFDENLSRQLASGMRGFGEQVAHLLDLDFAAPGTPDAVWLPEVGKRGLVLVTRDRRIRWRPAELAAYKDHGVGSFVLIGKEMSRCDIIQQLVRCWPEMKRLARKTRRPFLFTIRRGGKIVAQPL